MKTSYMEPEYIIIADQEEFNNDYELRYYPKEELVKLLTHPTDKQLLDNEIWHQKNRKHELFQFSKDGLIILAEKKITQDIYNNQSLFEQQISNCIKKIFFM